MPTISLTNLLDIFSAAGTSKATQVKKAKKYATDEYKPYQDFYKWVRECIIDFHRSNLSRKKLESCLINLTDKKKERIYPELVLGYKKWLGRKTITWFDPPRDVFTHNNFDITINPELGLYINGENHLIKLYFKADRLSKNRINIIAYLMNVVLGNQVEKDTIMSVLDIRRSKLISPTTWNSSMDGIVRAEMAYISQIWDSL